MHGNINLLRQCVENCHIRQKYAAGKVVD